MRSLTLYLSFLSLLTVGCSVWNPDYVQDPDEALLELTEAAEAGDGGAAAEQLQFAVEALATRHPQHVASQVVAASIAMERGQRQRAQGFVERALDLDARNVEARCLRVRIAVQDGNLDLARKIVEDGLQLRPDASRLYESAAWVDQLDERHDDAMRALDAAAALHAPAWRVAFHRGLIEELRGAYDRAEDHYRAAWKSNPSCREARERLAGLQARR